MVVLYIGACMLGGSSFVETVVFLGRFIDEPESVGAVAPSSKLLAEALVVHVIPGVQGAGKRFLEVGPGTGAVTEEVVTKLGPDDHLDLVELDGKLAMMLRARYAHHPQITVHCGSITQWLPQHRYDAIVMGIPFNALPFALVQEIWQHVVSLAKQGGVISYFSYLWLPDIKKVFLSKTKKREFKKIQRYLLDHYQKYGIGMKKVLPNVPPAVVSYLRFTSEIAA